MFKYLVCSCLIIYSLSGLAQDISYTELSRQLLDSEVMRSPVYTKQFYRAMRTDDTRAYQEQLADLEKMKQTRQISTKEYNFRKSALDNTYKDIYGNQEPARQAAVIKQAPVDAFYAAAMSNGRRQLLFLTLPELYYDNNSGLPPQKITDTDNPFVQTDYDNEEALTSSVHPIGKRVKAPEKQKRQLGQKNIPVNIGAFK